MIYQVILSALLGIGSAVAFFCLWLIAFLYGYILVWDHPYRVFDSLWLRPIYLDQPVLIGLIAGTGIGILHGLLTGLVIRFSGIDSISKGMLVGVIVSTILILAVYLLLGLLAGTNPVTMLLHLIVKDLGVFFKTSIFFSPPAVATGAATYKLISYFGVGSKFYN